MADENPDRKRRTVLKGIGMAASASVFGLGTVTAQTRDTAVSEKRARDILGRAELQAVIERVGVSAVQVNSATATELVLYGNGGMELDRERWIVVPHENDRSIAYNPEKRIAETETESGAVVRATPEDDGLFVEELEFGDAVTETAVATLSESVDYDAALERADVCSMNWNGAAAHFDTVSGTTRAFVPATRADGDEFVLLAELNATDDLSSVYGLPVDPDVGGDGGPIECWADCITFGVVCMHVCNPCVAVPTVPTCTPCAVCIGGTATVCAVACGIEEFW